MEFIRTREEPGWRAGAQAAGPSDEVYWAERNYRGYSLFTQAGRWYALPEADHAEFRAQVAAGLREAFPTRGYGTVLPFRRLFVIAYRD